MIIDKDKIYPALAYIKYRANSKNAHGIHSPFVFDLYDKAISKRTIIKDSEKVENVRDYLSRRNSYIDVFDFGATSKNRASMRRIKDITNNSVSNKKKCELLYNLVDFFKPSNIIELGTSFGLTAMYMSLAAPDVIINTVEGDSQTIAIANSYFKKLNFDNIKATNTTFDIALPEILEENKKADFIFFDGNHMKEPTLRYFNLSLPYSHNDSVFIFDDIHWSLDMNEAWQEIISHPQVTVSIDLFHFGIVFFKKELSKQNFVLKF